jgi:hypothetical protein
MDLKETKESLNKFAKYVVQQSRSNLTKNKKNYSKELYNSLGSEIDVGANSFSLDFVMEKYGIFQDRGVKGTESGRSLDNFRYKQSSNLKGFEAATGTFAKWAKFRNIRLRNAKGQFAKGNYKSIGFIIANSIKKKGIKPSLFFTKPFEKAFQNLPSELVEAYGLDVEQFLQYTIDKNGK